MAQVGPVTIGAGLSPNQIQHNWSFLAGSYVELGAAGASSLFADQTEAYYLVRLALHTSGSWALSLTDSQTSDVAGQELNESWEQRGVGAFTLRLAGTDYSFQGPNGPDTSTSDATEPYSWTLNSGAPDRATAASFITAWGSASVAQRNAITITFDDGATAPSFTDSTGDAISGTAGTAITDVTVPEASGTPAPTYAVVGTLPAGLDFDTATRVLSGTPTAAGSGTITIRATNSAGTADWTVAYSFVDATTTLDPDGFSATGTVHMLMHIRAGLFARGNGQENLWASTSWTADGASGQVGSILSGDAEITADVTLSRFARWDRSDTDKRLILNAVGAIGALFDEAADNYRLTLVRDVDSGDALITVGPPSGESSDRTFTDWRLGDSTLSQAAWDFLDAIASGDEILLAVHEGTASYATPTPPTVAVEFSAGSPAFTAVPEPGPTVRVMLRAGAPSFAVTPNPKPIVAGFRAGAPTFTAAPEAGRITPTVSAEFRAGTPTFTSRVRTIPRVTVEFRAGSPTFTVAPASRPVVSAVYRAGTPSFTAFPNPNPVVVGFRAGAPTLTVRVRTTPRVRIEFRAGEPELTANLLVPVTATTTTDEGAAIVPGSTLDVTTHAELVIQQWQTAPRFMALTRAYLQAVQEEFVAPVRELNEVQSNLETAEGVFLDWLGERLGYPRPSIPSDDLVWFGFEGSGNVGFNQAPFRSALEELQVLTPLGDTEYRRLLQARTVLNVAMGTVPDYEKALAAAGLDTATVADDQNLTLAIAVPYTGDLLELWQGVLQGPAGVATTVSSV